MRPCFDGLDEQSGGEVGIGRWTGSSMEKHNHLRGRGGFKLADWTRAARVTVGLFE
jgi:hypothetical protein